ncbi:MAG: substrate-binding domain-containing protein [Phycisphaerales bacterium]|jgi:ribose transport system substrate-binding protein|nr:substrate-binding domain-containing protein [Phycisphaerales bacterium]
MLKNVEWVRGAMGLFAAGVMAFAGACEKSPSGGSNAGGNASGGSGGSGGTKQAEYTIGVVAKSQSNPVFQAARKGAEDAARDLSASMGVKITINWRTPNAEDAQEQARFVEQLAAQGVDGIAISCTDANVATSAIDTAVGEGVVVVTFDSDAPKSKRLCYYGVDDVKAGAKVMDELARMMGGSGVVAVLAGNQAATNLQARVQGVREEAAKHAGISIKDVYYHPETAADAAAKMQQVQNTNPDITGWALVGGWPLYTDNALDGIYQNAKVCSMDPLPLPIEYVKKGQVQSLVGQPYYGWGYESVRIIMDKLHNGKDPESAFVTAPLDVVTSENADEYEKKWSQWLPK